MKLIQLALALTLTFQLFGEDRTSIFDAANLIKMSNANDQINYNKFQGLFTFSTTIISSINVPITDKQYIFIKESNVYLLYSTAPIAPENIEVVLKVNLEQIWSCFWSSDKCFQMTGMTRSGRQPFLSIFNYQGKVKNGAITGIVSIIAQEFDKTNILSGTFTISK